MAVETRADEQRKRRAVLQAEFDAMLAEVDAANTAAKVLEVAARANADAAKGAVQGLLAVGKRLEAAGIMERYTTEKLGPLF